LKGPTLISFYIFEKKLLSKQSIDITKETFRLVATQNRQKIHLTFYVIIIYLFAQFLFVINIAEPYPAFVFPLFGGVDGHQGIFDNIQQDIKIITQIDTIQISKQELLGRLPESQRYDLMLRMMGPETSPEVGADPGFRNWVLQTITGITNQQDPLELIVDWYRVSYDINTTPVSITRDKIGVFQMNLRY
jgi:hypothetical protein